MVLMLSAFLENALNISTMFFNAFPCFSMLETYSRERLGVAKITNALKGLTPRGVTDLVIFEQNVILGLKIDP